MGQQDEPSVEQMVREIIADGKLTKSEKLRLSEMILADGHLSVRERRCIDDMLTLIAKGELKVVD